MDVSSLVDRSAGAILRLENPTDEPGDAGLHRTFVVGTHARAESELP